MPLVPVETLRRDGKNIIEYQTRSTYLCQGWGKPLLMGLARPLCIFWCQMGVSPCLYVPVEGEPFGTQDGPILGAFSIDQKKLPKEACDVGRLTPVNPPVPWMVWGVYEVESTTYPHSQNDNLCRCAASIVRLHSQAPHDSNLHVEGTGRHPKAQKLRRQGFNHILSSQGSRTHRAEQTSEMAIQWKPRRLKLTHIQEADPMML